MVEERSEESASGDKSIQGRESSADKGPVAGAQRVKGELVMWAESLAEQVLGKRQPLPSSQPCCCSRGDPTLCAPRLVFLSILTGLCAAPNLWGCPFPPKFSPLNSTLDRGYGTVQH